MRVFRRAQPSPQTGAREYVLQGEARKRVESEFETFHTAMVDEAKIIQRLADQRARKAAEQRQGMAASVEREADLDRRAIERADEDEVARRAALITQRRRNLSG